MKNYAIVFIIVLFIAFMLTGCGGENMESLWIDTQGDLPAFIQVNEESLSELAEMMLAYDFDYSIISSEKAGEDEILVIVRTESTSYEENMQREDVENNEKLMAYASTLLEFQYIVSLDRSSADGGGIILRFKPIDYDDGSDSRIVKYISGEVLENHPRKEEYLKNSHVAGNWFYIMELHDELLIEVIPIVKEALKIDDLAGKEYIICELEEGIDYYLVRDENGDDTYQYCMVTGVDLQSELKSSFLAAGNRFILYVVDKKQFFDAESGEDITEYIVDGWDVLYPVKNGKAGILGDYVYESDMLAK